MRTQITLGSSFNSYFGTKAPKDNKRKITVADIVKQRINEYCALQKFFIEDCACLQPFSPVKDDKL